MAEMKIEYMAHSGTDLTVVNAARASFGKESDWDISGYEEVVDEESRVVEHHPVKVLKEKDIRLIDYLAREKHVLPFRHPQITLRIKVPIFLARQIGKHQVGMSWSEESRRYITTAPEFYWPDKWRKKAENVKQGSSDEEVEYESLWQFGSIQEDANSMLEDAVTLYGHMLEQGVAPELARMILPQNMMITAVWTGSLLSFFQVWKLRSEAHAQKEARDFAAMLKEQMVKLYPEAWAALERNV